MAFSKSLSIPLLISLLLFVLACNPAAAVGGGKLGGKTEVEGVKTNQEVQDLGRFCVQEYNKSRNRLLSFVEVVAAQKQVVAGMKYYLKISAMEGGAPKIYDAVVIVKPWIRSEQSKQLLSFSPSIN